MACGMADDYRSDTITMANGIAARGALKLSEQEKQEIIRYLEADRPLPDKYRFLLFEHKREVELVWNDKNFGGYCVGNDNDHVIMLRIS